MSATLATLSAADRTLSMARALVAFDPAELDIEVELEVAKLEYQREHGLSALADSWGRTVPGPGQEPWYFYVSGDGAGRSQATPPDAPIVVTFTAAGQRPTEAAVRGSLERLRTGELDPGRPMVEWDWTRLINALAVCADEARAETLALLAGTGPDGPTVIGTLDGLRSQFAADGYLTGEILATVMIRETIDGTRPAGTPVKSRLRELAGTAIEQAYEAEVQQVADHLRSQFSTGLRAADAMPSLSEYLDGLYVCLPAGDAASTLHLTLADKATDAARRDRERTASTAKSRRTPTRIRHAFVYHVTDIGGLQWHLLHQHILATRVHDGDDAANAWGADSAAAAALPDSTPPHASL